MANFLFEELIHGGPFGIIGITVPLVILLAASVTMFYAKQQYLWMIMASALVAIVSVGAVSALTYAFWLSRALGREAGAADVKAAIAGFDLIAHLLVYVLVVASSCLALGVILIVRQDKRRAKQA